MKFGLVGAGRMGRRHIQAAKNLGFEICGIFDPSASAVETALKEHSLPNSVAFGTATEMIQEARPEAVAVASTAPSHCQHVCALAAAGVRYVLCEKPMAVSLAECDRMVKACSRAGTVLAVNHQMRFMEQYTAVRELADAPAFGGLRSVTVCASNFGLSMNGSHYFEMFRFMTGEEIESVSSWLDDEIVPNPRGPQYEDRSGQLRAVTRSGARLYMEIGGDLGHGVQVNYGCRRGQIFVDELSGLLRLVYRDAQYADLPTTRYGMPAIEELRRIAPADVIGPTQSVWKAMLENRPFPDGGCGRHAMAALVAANVSGESGGQPVRLDELLPVGRVFPWA